MSALDIILNDNDHHANHADAKQELETLRELARAARRAINNGQGICHIEIDVEFIDEVEKHLNKLGF